MKNITMKKMLLVLGLGLGLSTVVNAKQIGDPVNCPQLKTNCENGYSGACTKYNRYC